MAGGFGSDRRGARSLDEEGEKYGFAEARRHSGYFRKMINGRLFRESTGFADRKAAERRANEIELHLQAVEDPRALQRRRDRSALRTLAEGGFWWPRVSR